MNAQAEHDPECDWMQQKPLINYKLDNLISQFNDFDKKFDSVFITQVKEAGANSYKRFLWPQVLAFAGVVGTFIAAAITFIQIFHH